MFIKISSASVCNEAIKVFGCRRNYVIKYAHNLFSPLGEKSSTLQHSVTVDLELCSTCIIETNKPEPAAAWNIRVNYPLSDVKEIAKEENRNVLQNTAFIE